MLGDTFRFLVIFSIVFLAFGSGITELYTPYAKNKNCTCNDTAHCNVVCFKILSITFLIFVLYSQILMYIFVNIAFCNDLIKRKL